MLARFWNLFRRRRLDLELNAELTHHLESLEAEHRARGLSKSDARMAALASPSLLARQAVGYRLEGTIGVGAGRLGQPVFGPMTLLRGETRGGY